MTNGVELSVCMHVWTLTVLLKLHASGSVCFRPHQPSRQLLKRSINHSAGHAWNMHLVSRVLDMNNAKRVNLVTTSLRHSNFIVKFFSLILPEEERIIKIMSLPIRLSEKPVIFFFFFLRATEQKWWKQRAGCQSNPISILSTFLWWDITSCKKGNCFSASKKLKLVMKPNQTDQGAKQCQEAYVCPAWPLTWRDLLRLGVGRSGSHQVQCPAIRKMIVWEVGTDPAPWPNASKTACCPGKSTPSCVGLILH